MSTKLFCAAMIGSLAFASTALGGDDGPAVLDGSDGRPLALEEFRPRPMLRVPEHAMTRAAIPVVDVHVHPRVRLKHSQEQLDEFVRLMDQQNVAVCVSLDGQMGEAFQEHQAYLWARHRQRFVIFANVDWKGDGNENDPASWDCQRPDFGRRMAAELVRLKGAGASGLKVFKELGLVYRNADGSLMRVDDARWDPIWDACGKAGLPVLIHTGDPAAFFEPIDRFNERWEELKRHPEWSFAGLGPDYRRELLAQLVRVVERHRDTKFIAAHLANGAEDLGQLGKCLDENPNLYVDLAARIAELGRQPVTARAFLIKYSDRVLFGTDGPRVAERLIAHWRFLETADEYFAYAEPAFPPQGFWRIYGVDLPDRVLERIYHANAVELIPGVRERYRAFARGKTGMPE